MATIISSKKVHEEKQKRMIERGEINPGDRLTYLMVEELTGIDKRTVSGLYRGVSDSVNRHTLDALRKFYECSYGDFFFEVPDEYLIRDANPAELAIMHSIPA